MHADEQGAWQIQAGLQNQVCALPGSQGQYHCPEGDSHCSPSTAHPCNRCIGAMLHGSTSSDVHLAAYMHASMSY
jgi:hypothetical protein